jgi:hypothetical protein
MNREFFSFMLDRIAQARPESERIIRRIERENCISRHEHNFLPADNTVTERCIVPWLQAQVNSRGEQLEKLKKSAE